MPSRWFSWEGLPGSWARTTGSLSNHGKLRGAEAWLNAGPRVELGSAPPLPAGTT